MIATRKTERQRDAERKRQARSSEREVKIPPCASRRRRNRLERDVFAWLEWYFPDVFCDPWTSDRREMVNDILSAVRSESDQAIAGPRGEGKTSIAECVVIFAVLTGLTSFPVILAATGPDAERILGTVRERFETNDRLAADYPEVCVPIRALENNPNRAHSQIVAGRHGRETYSQHSSRFRWCGREVSFPRVPGSPAAGAMIATRGLDAAIRGLKFGNLRPDLAIIDDPDTDETASSDEQAGKLEKRIDRNIAGLARPGHRLPRVMLTTLQSRKCVSAKFTNPAEKPSWNGKRFRLVVTWPERMDLWEEFMARRQSAQRDGDRDGKIAHAFYLANRHEMDRGAEVSNPHRYNRKCQSSTLEFCMCVIADIGRDAFDVEYQNDPKDEEFFEESSLTARRIQKQVSGFDRRVIPSGCTVLVQGADVRKTAIHWAVRAWRPDVVGYTIDYGIQEVHGTRVGSEDGVDTALIRAITARMEATRDDPYTTIDGEERQIALTLIDCRWRKDAVIQACKILQAAGFAIMPSMGHGQSRGCISTRYSAPAHGNDDTQIGDGYYLRRSEGVWIFHVDTDRWKRWEHDRWLTPPTRPGTLLMWGNGQADSDRLSDDEKAHHAYAHHIVGEREVQEMVRGEIIQRFKAKTENVHWLDASYLSDAAARAKGICLLKSVPAAKKRPKQRVTPLKI